MIGTRKVETRNAYRVFMRNRSEDREERMRIRFKLIVGKYVMRLRDESDSVCTNPHLQRCWNSHRRLNVTKVVRGRNMRKAA
jgi:hypothetical protein